jgi:hypothetical protein
VILFTDGFFLMAADFFEQRAIAALLPCAVSLTRQQGRMLSRRDCDAFYLMSSAGRT